MDSRRLLTLATLSLFACGSPSGPEPEPTGPPSLAIVSGDGQEVTVTDTLPFDAVVKVMRSGEPVPDQLVDWRVLEDNAGEPFVTTTRTDTDGTTKNRVIAGTRAHTHPDMDGPAHMEVRWVEQSSGEAIVDTTITFRVLPGEIDGLGSTAREGPDPLTLPVPAFDQYDNPAEIRAEVDSVFTVQGTEYGTEAARTLKADREGAAIVCFFTPDSAVHVGIAEGSPDGKVWFEFGAHPNPDGSPQTVTTDDC